MNKKNKFLKRLYRQRMLLLMLIPGLAYYLIFHYGPMYGILVAFKDYSPFLGVIDSPWVGLEHFARFFENSKLLQRMLNTLRLGGLLLIVEVPVVVFFALVLNEVRNARAKKFFQTVSYLPSFLSVVIICSLFFDLFSMQGIVNRVVELFGGEPILFLNKKEWYLPIYLISEMWAYMGSGAIIYLAALTGIDPSLYEAATIDGCSRIKSIWHISIPSIMPTIMTMFLLKVGGIIRVGADKTLLLYNELNYEVSDIISSYIYRVAFVDQDFSYSTAVGLVESLLGATILIVANKVSERTTGSSLW